MKSDHEKADAMTRALGHKFNDIVGDFLDKNKSEENKRLYSTVLMALADYSSFWLASMTNDLEGQRDLRRVFFKFIEGKMEEHFDSYHQHIRKYMEDYPSNEI